MKIKRVTHKSPIIPRCNGDPIIRNDIFQNDSLHYKPWHFTICNCNSDAAEMLSALIQLYDLDPDAIIDGELHLDDAFIRNLAYKKTNLFIIVNDALNLLSSSGLISIRRVSKPESNNASTGGGCYIRLDSEYIEGWLKKKRGWKMVSRRD
jgi:hypothetical protein